MKTTYIRNLVNNFNKKYLIITNTVAEKLGSPEFVSFMLDNKDSICILEDCEQIIKSRDNNFSTAINTILNMSDGILSDIFNLKFICTFNTDITNIDEALLRKGRCFTNYEFKALNEEKTKALLKEQGYEVEHPGEMTLAEIYNYNQADNKVKRKKAGF